MQKEQRTEFKDLDDAIEYFKEIYPVLPEEVLKNVIEYCVANPDKYPPEHDKIDLSKPPLPKKEKIIEIDDAVKIYNDLNDPEIKVIKHRDGACLLSEEEAKELQDKIAEALAKQSEDQVREYQELWKERNKKLLKSKIAEKSKDRSRK